MMEGADGGLSGKDIGKGAASSETIGLMPSVRQGTIIESKGGYKDKPEDLAKLDSDRVRLVEYFERIGQKVAPIMALHLGLMDLIGDEEWKKLSSMWTNQEDINGLVSYFGKKRQESTKPQEV